MKFHVFFVSRIHPDHPANSRHPKSAMHQSPVSCPGFPAHPQVLWPRQAWSCDRCDVFGLASLAGEIENPNDYWPKIQIYNLYNLVSFLKKSNLIEMIFCYVNQYILVEQFFWECRGLRILMGSCPNIDPMIGTMDFPSRHVTVIGWSTGQPIFPKHETQTSPHVFDPSALHQNWCS